MDSAAPCQDLAAMGWKMFVRPGFFYCFSEVSLAEGALDLRYSNSAGRGRLMIRQQR